MNREEILDKIEEIQNTSIGQSQTNKIADLIEQEAKAEVMDFLKWWVKGTVFKNIDKQELYQQFKEATK